MMLSAKTVTARADAPPSLRVFAPDHPQWLAFIGSHPEATVFHHPAWSSALSHAYGYRPFVLAHIDSNDRPLAGVPVVELRGLLSSRYVGLPFTDYCPPLASSPTAQAALTRDLVAWREAHRARELVLHSPLSAAAGVHLVSRAVRHTLPLAPSSDEILKRLNGGQVARAIRKARREGLTVRLSTSDADLETFYRLHLQTRRRLGIPIQPRRFVESIWRECIAGGLGFAVFAYAKSQPVATALFLAWNGTLIYKFGASDPVYWQLRPNNLVMWTAIEWGCAHGFGRLDFGRSDLQNQGLRDFKSRWGATEVPLVYSYLTDTPPSPTPNFVMQALARVIRSSPLFMCRAIGELFYRRAAGRFS